LLFSLFANTMDAILRSINYGDGELNHFNCWFDKTEHHPRAWERNE
jgi:hypothetical protein